MKHRAFFFAIIWYNTSMGTEKSKIRTLHDELVKYKDRNVYIGARSSFFFIGPAQEALDELSLLGAMLHHIAAVIHRTAARKRRKLIESEGSRLGQRRVIKSYEHDMFGSGMVILIEGGEFGMFWTRNEYVAERKKLLEEIS